MLIRTLATIAVVSTLASIPVSASNTSQSAQADAAIRVAQADQPKRIKELTGMYLRVIRPGQGVTHDFRRDRVNISVDANGYIQEISFH